MGNRRGWESTSKTNIILADIYDLLQVIVVQLGGNKNKYKPYPRPWETEDRNEQKFGKDALPPDDLHKWIKERQHG